MGTAVRFAVHDVIGYTYSRTEYILIFLAQLFLFGLFLKIPKQRVKPMLIMTGLFLLVAIGCLFVNGIIGYTPARVLTIPVIWVFLAFAIPVLLAASAVGQFVSSNLRGRAFLMLSVTSMLVWGWFFCGNISALQENRAAWLVRNDTLEKSRGQRGIVDTCGIPVLGSVMPDLIAEPDYEFNRVTALYYDIEFLRAETLCIE